VADNRITELAELDNDLLKDLLQELDASGLDMALTGFDESKLDGLLSAVLQGEIQDEDFDADAVAESITEPVNKPGGYMAARAPPADVRGQHQGCRCAAADGWKDCQLDHHRPSVKCRLYRRYEGCIENRERPHA